MTLLIKPVRVSYFKLDKWWKDDPSRTMMGTGVLTGWRVLYAKRIGTAGKRTSRRRPGRSPDGRADGPSGPFKGQEDRQRDQEDAWPRTMRALPPSSRAGRGRAMPPATGRYGPFRVRAIEADLAGLPGWAPAFITIKESAYPPRWRRHPTRPLSSTRRVPSPSRKALLPSSGRGRRASRACSSRRASRETLSSAAISVVSGLARGIDAAAHRGALGGRAGP